MLLAVSPGREGEKSQLGLHSSVVLEYVDLCIELKMLRRDEPQGRDSGLEVGEMNDADMRNSSSCTIQRDAMPQRRILPPGIERMTML